MDIKSLMVGDWVQLKTYGVSDKFERTEAYIFVKVAEIGSGLITVEHNNDIKEPYRICENTEIEPIPLTPEILEKNGFTKLEDESGKQRYRWEYADGIHISIDFTDTDPWVHVSNRCYFAVPYCEYVHQLQHALGLCGIYKEITL